MPIKNCVTFRYRKLSLTEFGSNSSLHRDGFSRSIQYLEQDMYFFSKTRMTSKLLRHARLELIGKILHQTIFCSKMLVPQDWNPSSKLTGCVHVHKYLGDWESQWTNYAGAYKSKNVILKYRIIGGLPPGISEILTFGVCLNYQKTPTNQPKTQTKPKI